MSEWMISGSGKGKTTSWGGGSISCKTKFQSKVVLVKDDLEKNPTTRKGQLVFDKIEPGDKLKFKVFTGAEKEKGKSDEFYMNINSLNWPYIVKESNKLYEKASKQEIARWSKRSSIFINALSKELNPSMLFLTYVSKINKTDSEGIYEGEYKFTNNIPAGPMTFNLMYGYNDDARSSDSSRGWDNAWDVISWVGLAVEIIIGLTICAGSAGLGCALVGAAFWAQFAAEIAEMSYDHLANGFAASLGNNQYGCSFPEKGFIHSYGLVYHNLQNDPFSKVDNENIETQNNNTTLLTSNLEINKTQIVLLFSAAGLFLMLSSIGGSE
jgi:hypothetical protein